MTQRVVYLLHFDPPYKHAGHYLGVAKNGLVRRWLEHKSGKGANLPRVARRAGSQLILARIWLNAEFALETKLKKQGGLRRQCPICKQKESNL